jgi:hypothetical protein
MRARLFCSLTRCVRENSFCAIYLFGLSVVVAFVTTLILGGGLLMFGISALALLLIGAWYFTACHRRSSADQHYPATRPTRPESKRTAEEPQS